MLFSLAAGARAQTSVPAIDSAAVRLLQRSMDYLGGVRQFTVHAENVVEDLLVSGQRVDYVVPSTVSVSRPDRLRVDRRGVRGRRIVYFDGSTVTVFDPVQNVYAKASLRGSLNGLFDFALDSLDLNIPVTDLLRPDVFPLLVQDITLARVIGREPIDGVMCVHLLFSRPHVDFQIWIPESGPPLPRRYIVTDTGTPALLSVVTTMRDWNLRAPLPASTFLFAPPKGAREIIFVRPRAALGSTNQ